MPYFAELAADSYGSSDETAPPLVLLRGPTGAEPDDDYRDWLTALLPDVRVTAFPDTGHFPHLARPAAFAELLHSIR
ncbi:MAG TPA: hypothetical protein VGM75_20745 [Pseudonocardiaceae bacterium]|jgi:pimeloyl-ACP methyl ester carboxylesterase